MVFHEVLRGARDQIRYEALQNALTQLIMLDAPMPLLRFEDAARLYRRCREKGVTPATPDCIIAATAIAHNAWLLQLDTDFRDMARVVPELKLVTRS
jgi:predicted nucleic acid-binding protein